MGQARLQGRHALVTGAARGIGAEIAMMLSREGARVTLLGRKLEGLAELQARCAGQTHAVAADVADEAAVQAAFEQARQRFGPVQILVNNAGQAESAPFRKTSTDLWQRMLSANLTGTFICTQAALPQMQEGGWGRIVNIASTAGLVGYAYVSAYTAAKHGVVGLTRALALEMARSGITVNAVCPGYTETDLLRSSLTRASEKTGRSETEVLASFTANNPQGRLVLPQEVADTVCWLCGESAAAITGQAISVSGGEVM